MKKSKIKRWLIITGSTVLTLFLVLVIHIYMVTRNKNDDRRIRQLARIDFKQEVDSSFANTVKNKVLAMDGVDAGYFNIPDKTFIYSFDPNKQNADKIFMKVMQDGNYKAVRFRVNDKLLASGCPVIDKSSFTYQVSAMVKRIIKN